MSGSRWERLEQVYHAALERPATDRAAFLAEACGDDGALREELNSLLACETAAGDFLQRPAIEEAGRALALDHGGRLMGRQVGG